MTEPPAAIQRLLQLFHESLAGVAFPGIDAAVLDTAAAGVQAAAREVERCVGLLEAARAGLAAAHDELLAKSQRALAYARVYAADAPALAAELEALALPQPRAELTATTAAPRRRGRPRTEPPALFAAEPSA